MRQPAGEPILTVVVRSHPGRVGLLRDTLYSITAQQRVAARALVVLDSHDSAHHAEVEGLRPRFDGLLEVDVIVGGNGGPGGAPAFNAGLDALTSRYCCFVDDGEVLYPRHAALLVGALEAQPGVAAAYGGGRRARGRLLAGVFVADAEETWHAEPSDQSQVLHQSCIALCATVLRTDALRHRGIRFDERVHDRGGWNLLRSVAMGSPMVAVDVTVCEHRMLGGETATWPLEGRDESDAADHHVVDDATLPGRVEGVDALRRGWDRIRRRWKAAR